MVINGQLFKIIELLHRILKCKICIYIFLTIVKWKCSIIELVSTCYV